MTDDEKLEAAAATEAAGKESQQAISEDKAAAKAGMEQQAAKAGADMAAVREMLMAADIDVSDKIEPKKPGEVALRWTDEKLAAGVSLNATRDTASSAKLGAQLCDTWIAGGRKGMIWTVALQLESVTDDTTIGIVGRNFYPSSWESELAASRHAIVLRCGDGMVTYKGKSSSFVLRPLKSGDKLSLTLDMQTLAMTVELMGKDVGSILASVELESLPAELTVAVGFAASAKGAPQQRVRIVGCTCEKPGMQLSGKRVKDLWDDENVQSLEEELRQGKAGGSMDEQLAAVASTLGGD